jgi:hypothetical protein
MELLMAKRTLRLEAEMSSIAPSIAGVVVAADGEEEKEEENYDGDGVGTALKYQKVKQMSLRDKAQMSSSARAHFVAKGGLRKGGFR